MSKIDMIALYNGLFGVALALICFTLAPALFSAKVRRRLPWTAQMITWLVYSASYLLLVGRQQGQEPQQELCLFQTALIYSVDPLYVVNFSHV